MDRASRRRSEAVRTIAAAVALAGCRESTPPAPCDLARLELGVAQLREAQPAVRPLVSARAIRSACGSAVPGPLTAFLGLVSGTFDGRAPPNEPASEAEVAQLLAATCPDASGAFAGDPRAVFDACGRARHGVVSRDEVSTHFGGTPAVWALHAWLLAQDVRPATAAPLARGLFFWEAWHANVVGVHPGLSLVRVPDAAPVAPLGLPIHVDLEEIRVDGRPVVDLDDGQAIDLTAVASAVADRLAAGGVPSPVLVVADRRTSVGLLVGLLRVLEPLGEPIALAVRRDGETAPYGVLAIAVAPVGVAAPITAPADHPLAQVEAALAAARGSERIELAVAP
jgi:hypothetical protein